MILRASDIPGPVTDSDAEPATTEVPASLAEAEEELARAEARAEAARAHAAELRRQAEASSDDADEIEPAPAQSRRWRRWRVPRPSPKAVGIATATVLICASLLATAYMVWQHLSLVREHRHAAEFAAAARRGVEMMMSIDPDHARENVQGTIDVTTGPLKSQLEATSSYMVKNAQDAKVITKATVQDTAVESMTNDSAVILVVAKSDTTNPDKSRRPPAFWRLSVNIDRDGGQLKMSKLDFVQ